MQKALGGTWAVLLGPKDFDGKLSLEQNVAGGEHGAQLSIASTLP